MIEDVDKRLSVGIRQETHEFLYQANLSNFCVLRVSIVIQKVTQPTCLFSRKTGLTLFAL